jgi:hypothetical protein
MMKIELGSRIYIAPGTGFDNPFTGKIHLIGPNRIIGADYDGLLETGKVYKLVKRENGTIMLCPVGQSIVMEDDLVAKLLNTPVTGNSSSGFSFQGIVGLRRQATEYAQRWLHLVLMTRYNLREALKQTVGNSAVFSSNLVKKHETGVAIDEDLARVEVDLMRELVEIVEIGGGHGKI